MNDDRKAEANTNSSATDAEKPSVLHSEKESGKIERAIVAILALRDRLSERLAPVDDRLTEYWRRFISRNLSLYFVVAAAVALFVPALGSVGLWDCWEPHYAEVAREMYNRGDFWHPHWESYWFFSKPVGLFWLEIAGFFLLNVDPVTPGVNPREEWAIRAGPALLSILCLFFAYYVIARLFNKRVALFAALIMMTSPFYFFLSRQAITDMPFVACMTISLLAFMMSWFSSENERRPLRGWLVLAYVAAAVSGLMKGIPGFVIPAMVVFAYLLISAEWQKLFSRDFFIASLIGVPLFLLIFLPWYIVMFIHNPGNDCSIMETLKDQFKYYWQSADIKQCAARDENNRTFFERFFVHDHINRLTSGVHGERGFFDYFIQQIGVGMFPWSAIAPFAFFNSATLNLRQRDRETRAKAFIFVWTLFIFVFFAVVTTKFHHYIFPIVPPLAIIIALYLDKFLEKREMSGWGLFSASTLAFIILIGRDIIIEPKLIPNLFVYKYEREYPQSVSVQGFIAAFLAATVFSLFIAFFLRKRHWFTAILFVSAFVFAAWGSWYLFNMLSPHWSQRYYFETYYRERSEDAPIAAFLLNWRGETYYSKNTVRQLKSEAQIKRFLEVKPELEKYFICEQYRYSKLKERLPEEYRENVHIVDRSNNKYYLVRVDPLSEQQKEQIEKERRERTEIMRKEREKPATNP
ncbi:MAG: hypothetical protein Kow0090_19140 [Myxococcota bacterium]